MTHLFLATPCYGGVVTLGYFHGVTALLLHAERSGLAMSVETLAMESLISRARNTLVAKFLAHPTATHLLFIDADIGFAPAHVMRLLAMDVDVAAAMYPLKQMFWDAAAVARARGGELISTAPLRYVGEAAEPGRDCDGFVTALFAGTGFMLIARRAITRLAAAHPELRYGGAHVPLSAPVEHLYALFDTSIDPVTRAYLSEDYTFCARWRALGGDIWLDTTSQLTHTGSHDYSGDPSVRFSAP